MTDWKRAAEVFENVPYVVHRLGKHGGEREQCPLPICVEGPDFIAALRAGGPVVSVPGAAEALHDAAHYRHEDMCQGKFADCDIPRCVAARETVAKLRMAESAPPTPDAVTRALEAIVEAAASGSAEVPDALLVAAQNALGDAGKAETPCPFDGGPGFRLVNVSWEVECRACGRTLGSHDSTAVRARHAPLPPPPFGDPSRWTEAHMTTHAACLPGEGCRVEPGMRFEAAKAIAATLATRELTSMSDDARDAVCAADLLLAELAKAKP